MSHSKERVRSRIDHVVRLMDAAKTIRELAEAQEKLDELCKRLADDAHLSKYQDYLIRVVRHVPGMAGRMEEAITHLIAARIPRKPLLVSLSHPVVKCTSVPPSAIY